MVVGSGRLTNEREGKAAGGPTDGLFTAAAAPGAAARWPSGHPLVLTTGRRVVDRARG